MLTMSTAINDTAAASRARAPPSPVRGRGASTGIRYRRRPDLYSPNTCAVTVPAKGDGDTVTVPLDFNV